MTTQKKEPVILDFGSMMTLAGFAGAEDAQIKIRSCVGRPLFPKEGTQEVVCGDECRAQRGRLKTVSPICKGFIFNFDDWVLLLNHTFKELKIDTKEHPVLLLEKPYTGLGYVFYQRDQYPFTKSLQELRQKICQTMFEKFNVPSLYIMSSAVATLHAHGLKTGVVLEIGEYLTQCTTVYEGLSMSTACSSVDFGGWDLTDYLRSILQERGYSFTTTSEFEMLREIKLKYCYVLTTQAKEFELWTTVVSGTEEKSVQLPDGQTISLMNEQYRCVEPLFQPYMLGGHHRDKQFASPGLHQLIYHHISRNAPEELREELWKNVVVTGDFYPGLDERLKLELRALAPKVEEIRVLVNPKQRHTPWCGASSYCAAAPGDICWIEKKDYELSGPTIVHYKCIDNNDSPGNCARHPSKLKIPLPPIPVAST
eukprot:Phypoly_transcript_09785.p1 GENE.Phypoly_transcript_09785~~Phypoly_transcript_09785.p1  ORF type:complete len:439 (+),score=42.30 Phypoly_transcript_09785:43-1317(+)